MQVSSTSTESPRTDNLPLRTSFHWVAVLLGVGILLVAFFTMRWFAVDEPEGGQAFIPFSALDDLYFYGPATGLRTHFEPLALLCAALSATGAFGSFVHGRTGAMFAALGGLAATAGIWMIAFEIRVTGGASYTTWLGFADKGLWFAVAGLLLVGGAAVTNRIPARPDFDSG